MQSGGRGAEVCRRIADQDVLLNTIEKSEMVCFNTTVQLSVYLKRKEIILMQGTLSSYPFFTINQK